MQYENLRIRINHSLNKHIIRAIYKIVTNLKRCFFISLFIYLNITTMQYKNNKRILKDIFEMHQYTKCILMHPFETYNLPKIKIPRRL